MFKNNKRPKDDGLDETEIRKKQEIVFNDDVEYSGGLNFDTVTHISEITTTQILYSLALVNKFFNAGTCTELEKRKSLLNLYFDIQFWRNIDNNLFCSAGGMKYIYSDKEERWQLIEKNTEIDPDISKEKPAEKNSETNPQDKEQLEAQFIAKETEQKKL